MPPEGVHEGPGRQIGATIENVGKVYETRGEPIVALENCSLDLAPGEFVSVVGPSGCGKSTLHADARRPHPRPRRAGSRSAARR